MWHTACAACSHDRRKTICTHEGKGRVKRTAQWHPTAKLEKRSGKKKRKINDKISDRSFSEQELAEKSREAGRQATTYAKLFGWKTILDGIPAMMTRQESASPGRSIWGICLGLGISWPGAIHRLLSQLGLQDHLANLHKLQLPTLDPILTSPPSKKQTPHHSNKIK